MTSGCLVAGTYWVKETKPPDGYVIANPEPVEVHIRHPDPPDTGMADWTILVAGGIALMGGGALLLLTRRRKALQTR